MGHKRRWYDPHQNRVGQFTPFVNLVRPLLAVLWYLTKQTENAVTSMCHVTHSQKKNYLC